MKYKQEALNDWYELENLCWRNDGYLMVVANEADESGVEQQFISVWQHPNGITKTPPKTKILIDESSRRPRDFNVLEKFNAMLCNRETDSIVLGGETEWDLRPVSVYQGFVITVAVETGQAKEKIKLFSPVGHVEEMSSFGVIGLTEQTIFTFDFRMPGTPTNVKKTEDVYTVLSFDRSSGHHFVVGNTAGEAMIFDVRNAKKPITYLWEGRKSDDDVDHLNWSGNYIFVSVDRGAEPDANFFWDVKESTKIEVNLQDFSRSVIDYRCSPEWIGEHIVIKMCSGSLFSTSPNSTDIRRIDFISEIQERDENELMEDERTENSPGTFGIKKIAFCKETMQLAGLNKTNIFVWSHDKCQPQTTLNN